MNFKLFSYRGRRVPLTYRETYQRTGPAETLFQECSSPTTHLYESIKLAEFGKCKVYLLDLSKNKL